MLILLHGHGIQGEDNIIIDNSGTINTSFSLIWMLKYDYHDFSFVSGDVISKYFKTQWCGV